jgi:hypothetical protein
LADGRLATHGPCRGLPCPIIATHVAEGTSTILADAAGLAALVPTAGGPRLVFEAGDRTLRITDLDGVETRSVPVPDPGLRLVPPPSRAHGGARLPDGWIALAPEGRLEPDEGRPGILLRVTDGATWELQEAGR